MSDEIRSASSPQERNEATLHDVMEALRRAQEAEKRLADLISTIPGVVWEFDRRKQAFTLISDYARVLTCQQVDKFLENPQLFLQQIHPDDFEQFNHLWEVMKKTRESTTWLFRLRSPGHSEGWRWMRSEIVPVVGEGGEVVAARGVTYDIHHEVQTRQLLQRHTQQLEALIDFSSRFVEAQTEDEVLIALCELINSTLDFKYLAIYLKRRDGVFEKALVGKTSVGWEKVELPLSGAYTRLREVLEGVSPHFISQNALQDVSRHERQVWQRILGAEARVFSNAVVPIRGRTQVLGAMAVDRRDTAEPITDAELSMLLTIGRYAGLALDNVRLLHEWQVAEERLRHLVQNLPVTVWELNLETRQLEFVSEYVEKWLGYSPEEWRADPWLYRTIVHPEDVTVFEKVISADSGTVTQPLEVRLRDRWNKWHWCRILWTITSDEEGVRRIRGVTTDITTQKMAEQQQLHLMRLRSLGEIASGVAHNFNNILMGIMGNAELLQTSLQYDPELRRRVEIITQLAHDASAIVRRMQGFYKLQPPTQRERMNLRVLIEDVVESTRPVWSDLAARRGASITVQLIADADPVVNANRSELHEVFTNLIINACDAMPMGGSITVKLSQQDGQAVVEVADTGVGMTPEVREQCFDAFFTTKGENGSGLGLSVSYQIIARHSGQVSVCSEVGKGTTFTVRLPIAEVNDVVQHDVRQDVPATNLRILTVEDDEAVRAAIRHLLEADGHQVTDFGDAATALAQFAPNRYDVAILDLGMPHLDGLTLARKLKQISPTLPVIMLTGWGDQLRGDEPRDVDLVLTKPVRRAALRAALLQLAHRQENG